MTSVERETYVVRPRMRGTLHAWAFFLFLAIGAWLVIAHREGRWWPAAVFASSVVGLFGTSALFHRITWSPVWYRRMRRLDHTMIFGLIVGTYTPVFVVALVGRGVDWVFGTVCVLAAIGAAITVFWPGAPKWVRSVIYVTVGWVGAMVMPALIDAIGWSGFAMLIGGGVVYSIGALVYALKRPDPFPKIFGYHEIFHALVIAAVGMHYACIAFWVLA